MTTFNKDMMYAAGLAGVVVGVVLGLAVGAANGNRPETLRFDESKVVTFEQSYWTLGEPMTTVYHAMYDDGKYTYEASDVSRTAAIAAVRNMVLA